MPLVTPAAGVMDPLSPSLHHTKHQLLLLTRMAPHNIVSTLLVFDPLFQIGNKAAHTLYCLPSWHSSYWGTGTPSNICKAPTLFSSQIKSFFSVLLPKEKIPLYFMFHFIKAACLLSFYRKYFNCSFWNSSPAWDKMLRTQKNLFYYFNLEKLGRLFPLGWLEWSYFTLRIFLYFPSKAMSYSHTLFPAWTVLQ